MSVNIACSMPECTNPVIGQCTGYKKNCGRYYCHKHSSDTLCADCAKRKVADEQAELEQKVEQERVELVYQEYLALAEKVSREPIAVGDYKVPTERIMKAAKESFVAGLVLSVIPLLVMVFSPENNPSSTVLLIMAVLLFVPPVMIISLELYSSRAIWYEKAKERQFLERVNAIEQERKGFGEFWKMWLQQRKEERAEKRRQALVGILAVVGAIAAGAIASSLSESEYDRTRRAVRDEMNRS